MLRTDKTLDIKGLVSPRAEVITRRTLDSMGPGQVLTVVTNCRTIQQKMSLLCEALGCTLVDMKEEEGTLSIQIRK